MKTTNKASWSWAMAALAIGISLVALWLSYLTRQDIRDLGHLDLKPNLAFKTAFKTERSPTHFRIRNTGPVPATQIRVEGKVARYFEQTNTVMMEFGISDLAWDIGDLKPLQDTAIVFDELLLQIGLDPRIRPEHHIFVMRLRYCRPSDKMIFVEQAYYFLNLNGRWCNEFDGSLVDSIYLPIKKAAFAWPPPSVPLFLENSDQLHPVAPDNPQS